MIYEDPKEILQHLNNYFAKVGPEKASTIPNTNSLFTDYLQNPITMTFNFTTISPREIENLINKLENKGCDIKSIPNQTLKLISNSISHPMANLDNVYEKMDLPRYFEEGKTGTNFQIQ